MFPVESIFLTREKWCFLWKVFFSLERSDVSCGKCFSHSREVMFPVEKKILTREKWCFPWKVLFSLKWYFLWKVFFSLERSDVSRGRCFSHSSDVSHGRCFSHLREVMFPVESLAAAVWNLYECWAWLRDLYCSVYGILPPPPPPPPPQPCLPPFFH